MFSNLVFGDMNETTILNILEKHTLLDVIYKKSLMEKKEIKIRSCSNKHVQNKNKNVFFSDVVTSSLLGKKNSVFGGACSISKKKKKCIYSI